MTYEERVVHRRGDAVAPSADVVERRTEVSPSGGEIASRLIVLVFGIIQVLIALRIVLLILDANQGNGIVAAILDLSGVFVAPFEGMLNTNAVNAGQSVLDVAAVAAIVGWTLLEAIVLWIANLFRREPA